MAWLDEITEMVRVLIGDMSDTQTYCDERIQRVAIIGAHQVINDVSFSTTYTLNISTTSLSPDPTSSPRDEGFLYLVSLKTACLIMTGEARAKSLSSLKVSDGPSSVDTGAVYINVKDFAKLLCDKYEDTKMRYVMGTLIPGAAIMTPTTQEGIEGGFLDTRMVGRYGYCFN